MKINMPEAVKNIIDTLEKNGFEAYIVGGCVRDCLLGKEPKDWDITTSAKPEDVKALFRKTIDTGIKHGTVTVLIKGQGYEVTTYRIDGEYEDGRHPKQVEFTSNLVEDLKRRDFTINAMAYNDSSGIVDCFEGMRDLERGIIKCVGVADERFSEDALRMLRAIRFAAVLDFDIDENTGQAIKKLAPAIEKISRERIQVELDKLIVSDHPEKIKEIYNTGLIEWIFEGDDIDKSLSEELADKLRKAEKNHFVRWAVFITYVKERGVLKGLKFDNETVKVCEKLYQNKDDIMPDNEADIRKMVVRIGRDIFEQYYLAYREALGNAHKEEIERIKKMYRIIADRGDCLSMKELKINGKDLADIGIPAGKQMGDILDRLFAMVLEDHKKNKREILIDEARTGHN